MNTQSEVANDRVQSKAAEYATEQDFCNIFLADMQSLYLLALMLTGDESQAEQSFTAALSDCHRGASTFKAWASTRSRLAVVERAIKNAEVKNIDRQKRDAFPLGLSSQMAATLRLDTFHRFVFVLTVLEKYSVRDCAILLRRRVPEIEAARLKAMTIIAAAPERQVLSPSISLLSAAPLRA